MLVLNEKIPEKVILVEEPEIADLISRYMKVVKTIRSRGYTIHIGLYNNSPVAISSHGVGGPSLALILEELIQNGAKVILRYGTAGAIECSNVGKYLIPLGVSHHTQSSLYQRIRGDIIPSLFPDLELAFGLYKFLKERRRNVIYGSIFQSDDFYAESHITNDDAIDMETGTLFLISRLKKVRAVSLVILANCKGKDWIDYESIYSADAPLILQYMSNIDLSE
ncbi:hypothetical protein [Stygiolobus azoricus]|uniref:Nucleoside phosphorylase domain-containing protein n=1 Tax=Stygiolobus azoricus TaxID=41675 RepID=A0A650CPJ0_9CREN|nr:hypothetical protein [Stygiolobus azoricus]QGR19625.1 hypothetical protein D1868_06200 [Stygiolobus azoricus]